MVETQQSQYIKPLPTISFKAPSGSVFSQDSTATLIKKFFVYKLMGSDLFINHSLTLVELAYKILGVKLTNFAVNKSVASLFTSGETLQSLMQDKAELQRKNIGGVGMSVVEGMPEMNHE